MQTLPAHMQSAFDSIFGKPSTWHSEADKQDAIARIAKDEEQQIVKTLLSNNKDAQEVSDAALNHLGTSDMQVLIRVALMNRPDLLQKQFLELTYRGIKDVAEIRAEQIVDELGVRAVV